MRTVWCLALVVTCACNQQRNDAVAIKWDANKPTGILIPQSLLQGFNKDSIDSWLQVHLVNGTTSVIGEYDTDDKQVIFKPLIGFTRGLTYQVNWKGKQLQQVEIPGNTSPLTKPVVREIYPTGDSLPANLLKMYVVFSEHMREGQAANNIKVIKNGRDTISSIFLNLEPELWDSKRLVFTIWLDPGRIKRGLQPNEKLGPPLETGNYYEILIDKNWESADGVALASTFKKKFTVIGRDDKSPDPHTWIINSPKKLSQEPLRIQLRESLDYFVLYNTITIEDEKGNELPGRVDITNEETTYEFTPMKPWPSGTYSIRIVSVLADLAGNNLQRLFDRDILKDSVHEIKEVRKSFIVQ